MPVRGSPQFRVSGLAFKGHSRSAEVTRFDREGMTSYFSNWSYFVSFSTYAAIFSENRNFFALRLYLTPVLSVLPSEFYNADSGQKTGMMVSDGRTDFHTEMACQCVDAQ